MAEKTPNRYVLLYELFQSITATLDPQKALNLIIDAAIEITSATNGSLVLVDWDEGVLDIKVSRGFMRPIKGLRLPVGEGVTGWVAKTGEPLNVNDVTKEPRYVAVKADIRSELAVPLKLEEKLIGVVNVDSTRANAFSDEDVEMLTLLANQSAQVIKNGNLFTEISREVDELSALIDINKVMTSTLSPDKILSMIVERTARLTGSKICSVLMLSEDEEELILRAQHGGSPQFTEKPRFPIISSPRSRALREQQLLEVYDVPNEFDGPLADLAKQEGFVSMLSVPLIARGKATGLINLYTEKAYRFKDREKRILRTFADLCAIALDNASLYQKMVTLEEESRRAERLTAAGELAVGIAHEIRNPLTIVKMIFEAGEELTGEDRSIIHEEIERMNKIISNLLDYTRPQEPQRSICHVRKALENAILLVSHTFDKNQINVHQHLRRGLPRVLADPVQLQQIFLNLLINASDALDGKGDIWISTGAEDVGNVWIEIRDNGPGLSDKIKDTIFEPFVTTKSQGLGIGLAIVKRLVDEHGGSIEIGSEPGKGTRVYLVLPPAPSQEKAESA